MVDIVIRDIGDSKVQVIRIVRETMGIDLKEAKDIVDNVSRGNTYTIPNIPEDEANAIVGAFAQVGAKAIVTERIQKNDDTSDPLCNNNNLSDCDGEKFIPVQTEQTKSVNDISKCEKVSESLHRKVYQPIVASSAVSKLGRDGTLKVLAEVRKIAKESERIDSEINTISKKIKEEKEKAEALRKCVSGKAKAIICIATLIAAIVGTLIVPVLFTVIFGVIVLVIMNLTVKKSDLKKHKIENDEKADVYAREHIEPLQIRLNELFEIRTEIFESGKRAWAIDVVGENLFYSVCIDDLYNLVKSRRADNVKEALNKYDDSIYKARMEEMQKSIQNASEISATESLKHTKQLRQIEKNTREAARASKIDASINYSTYVDRKKKK